MTQQALGPGETVAKAGNAPAVPIHMTLQEVAVAGSAAWPHVHLPDGLFVAYVAARLPRLRATNTRVRVFAADLYLACGCVQGSPAAVAAFETEIMPEVGVCFRRLRNDPAVLDDLQQSLRERLLVGSGGHAPRIAEYCGREPLRSWVRIVATRMALNAVRSLRFEMLSDDSFLGAATAPGKNPEQSCIYRTNSADVRRAFDKAMESLTPAQRVLLRQHFIDGLTTDQIGKLYRKHRVTVLRRLDQVLRLVRSRTRRFVERDLGCSRDTAQSLVTLGISGLDQSIHRYLGELSPSTR